MEEVDDILFLSQLVDAVCLGRSGENVLAEGGCEGMGLLVGEINCPHSSGEMAGALEMDSPVLMDAERGGGEGSDHARITELSNGKKNLVAQRRENVTGFGGGWKMGKI